MTAAPLAIVPPVGRRGVATVLVLVAVVAASFASLSIDASSFSDGTALALARDFVAGFLPPDLEGRFVGRVGWAALETLAMSAIGTLCAIALGMLLAIPASSRARGTRVVARFVLALLRAIPELVWAALLVIAAGLGPLPGTLALAIHTTGVLGRLFADTLENVPAAPADALRAAGVGRAAVFCHASLPQALPQFVSYALYRWENNIRAAAILGLVGAGGLGQMLVFHLSLFQMQQVATVVAAIILLVALVDAASAVLRRRL